MMGIEVVDLSPVMDGVAEGGPPAHGGRDYGSQVSCGGAGEGLDDALADGEDVSRDAS